MPIRILPCLDIRDGRVVKGVQFANLKDAGDPVEIAGAYSMEGADELVLLDVKASAQSRVTMLHIVQEIVQKSNIPLVVGGGINNLENIEDMLAQGVKKVSIGSASITNPKLIKNAASKFGSKSIVVSIDAKMLSPNKWEVYIGGGRINTNKDAIEWAKELQDLGAGEILLNSMDGDGTKGGYDIDLLKAITRGVDIPVIASGGAGKLEDFKEAVIQGGAKALLAASLFHFRELNIGELKDYLEQEGVKVYRKDMGHED